MDDPHRSVYQAVVARRLQWDNLLWQVPLLSLTAQAFLFTIALGADTSKWSRTLAATLSVVVAVLCVSLMARHRQAELSDAHWLEVYEEGHPEHLRVHGSPFVERRNKINVRLAAGRLPVPTWKGYETWTWGMAIFGLIGLLVVVLTWIDPSPLHA
ncbi:MULTISPECIES: hypothetical protein [unclassified Arthrobacter]|uniref:hypothetical protein n=1 Tax=unclassified Arthrobacter TaxID=235627 RepID=UPI00254AD11C|nr:hypothetical protein [Arthrobacter sp. efr-133-TYG-120]